MRVYRNDQDSATSRVELGDKLALLPGLFPDPPAGEQFVSGRSRRTATTSSSTAAHGFFPDVMCVVADAGLLVYRIFDDPSGQVWTVKTLSAS